ncbi:MAG TPA: DNA repair protein RecN [Steroidobacteraceae bacterium]|nr:DNA repair protein RecN [Steroidobacteraceae bacterium]
MLTHLQIRDFAIVEAVEFEPAPGFTALTGETGAGKSILVDALLLAVGGRADSGSVRHGAERAEVSATFEVSRNPAALAWLEEQSITHEGEVQLRRVTAADGRGRAYINGQSVSVQSLRALGELMLDVHGQLEFQSLSRRPYQRALLDGSGRLAAAADAVRAAYQSWRALEQARAEFDERGRDRAQRLEMLSHYVAELDALDAKAGEAASLNEERRRMASLGRLAEGTRQVCDLLAADGSGASDALARSQSILKQLVSLDATLSPLSALLDEASISCREALAGLDRYVDSLEADPARQERVESRLAALEAAARKHRVEVDELPELRQRLADELAGLGEATAGVAELERRTAAALAAYESAARTLSERRRAAAAILDREVSALMQELGMRGGVFATRIETPSPLPRSEHGADEIEFFVSANPGQPPKPLAKTASGGELSRISLALQVATLDASHLPCLVFDEVDAGVGGAVAEMVGRQLRALAESGQVLCVTHLPQVAAQASHQVRVVKRTQGGVTRTALEALDGDGRIEELARMLGGARVTDRAREHAREMLESNRLRARSRPASVSGRDSGSSRARSGRGA